MNSGTSHCRHYATGRPVRVTWSEGIITALEETGDAPPQDVWIAPSLVDLQINGYAGVDFQGDGVKADELMHAANALRRDGCGRFLLTLITDEWGALLARLKHFKKLRDASPALRDAIIGWHIEGPFLSERPGFHGAHDPALMLDPTPAHIRALGEIAGGDPLLLTIAPERHGAIDAIRFAAALGAVVSLGHTDATTETLRAAVQAGARGFTHLANGCPRELDRHDNILWRVCETPGLTASLIPDGIHVSPAPFRLLHRLLKSGEGCGPNDELQLRDAPSPAGGPRPPLPTVYYTTDAMSAAGAAPGRYRIGRLEVEVGADQVVRQPGRTNFAGSALRPVEGVFRAAKMLSCPWQDCWRRFSQAPARLVGAPVELRVGSRDFCVVNPAAETVSTFLK
jgi:N-acetylglucosamine-6-phosphate deacetylase